MAQDPAPSSRPERADGDIVALGLESSCDETAAAIVRRRADGSCEILADEIYSQLDEHALYGGVVPEIAARAHAERMDRLVMRALDAAGLDFADLDAVAATAGPGLIGGVIVGLTTAKAIALGHGLPLIAVNHLEGHALSPRMIADTPFPYLLLLVSGGHTQLIAVEDVGVYARLGTTIDDALGEAFDKTAKLLGLGYPGGPNVEKAARDGDAAAFKLPRPLKGADNCDFSFSGLKTAVRTALEDGLGDRSVSDLAASFQAASAGAVGDRVARAMTLFRKRYEAFRDRNDDAPPTLVAAGGVAANAEIRRTLEAVAESKGFRFIVPPAKLCTDNGAMIAYAGAERFARGMTDGLDVAPRARWPLDPAPPPHAGVYGKKGAKA